MITGAEIVLLRAAAARRQYESRMAAAIRDNLLELVADETIWSRKVHTLRQPRFCFAAGQRVPQMPLEAAGDQPGKAELEQTISIEDITDFLCDQLELPNSTQYSRRSSPRIGYSLAANGPRGSVDVRRTLLSAIRRQATLNRAATIPKVTAEDFRFRTWEEHTAETQSGLLLTILDTSGSMTLRHAQLARTFFYWLLRLIRRTHPDMRVRHIVHNAEGSLVDEDTLLRTKANGGTCCSSGYRIALQQLNLEREASDVYLFHVTDGYNLPADNRLSLQLARSLLTRVRLFGYCQIEEVKATSDRLGRVLQELDDPHFVLANLRSKEDLIPSLHAFLSCVSS